MKTRDEVTLLWKLKGWTFSGIGLLCFTAGSLLTLHLMHTELARADNDRLFELRIYHDLPGKLPVMESRFRDKTSELLAKHNLNVVGYWVTSDVSASKNSFIFLLAHQSREEAKKNWQALSLDPEFREIENAEHAEKTLESADVIYMRPADFSPMK